MRMAKSIANVCIVYVKMSQYQSFFISAPREKNGHQKIDWCADLATNEQREFFDKMKRTASLFSQIVYYENLRLAWLVENFVDKILCGILSFCFYKAGKPILKKI